MIKVCVVLACAFVGAVVWACCAVSSDCSRREEETFLDSAFDNDYGMIGY